NRSLQALEESFAARYVCHFGEIALSIVHLEQIAAEAADAAGVERVNYDAGLLRAFNCRIYIRAERIAAEAIDSIGDQQNLAARARHRPALDQIHDREIDAGIRGDISEGQANALANGFVVRAELRRSLDGAITRVENCDTA